MIIVEGTARLSPEKWEKARAGMEKMIRASREEEGCIDYAYSVDLLDPGLMRIIERWKDREALAYHFSTPHMAEFRALLAEVRPDDITVRMFDAEPEALPL